MEREWGNEGKGGGNGERMRKCRESISLHFLILSPFHLHFLILSPFPLHFLILSPFPLHFLILSPFPRSPAPRLKRVLTPCMLLTLQNYLEKAWQKLMWNISNWMDANLQVKIGRCWQKLAKIWFSSAIGTLSKSVPEQKESTWKVSFIFVTSRHTKTQSCHLLHCLYPLCHDINHTKSWFFGGIVKF